MKRSFQKTLWVGLLVAASFAAGGCADVPFALSAAPLASAVSVPAPAQSASAAWTLVWADEFDGAELDRTRWAPEVSCWGGGNNERQCYTDRPENIRVEEGLLRLIARPETHTGPLLPDGAQGAPGGERTQDYTSGKLRTRGLASWRYGRFSARILLPEGQGTWPAFWMMPEEDAYGVWPLSGEMDIMEAVNLETPCEDCADGIERRTSGALHFGARPPENTYLFLKSKDESTPGPSREWRTYSLEWGEGIIQWLVDGRVFLRIEGDRWFTASPLAEGREFAPFDQPFHIAINLAVGGNLAERSNGAGFDPQAFPAEMLVDWVRVETCSQAPNDCLTDQGWEGEPQGPWEVQAR